MAKINPQQVDNAIDEAQRDLSIVASLALPSMVCGVSRKINTGNFESIDVYSGITIPISYLPDSDLDAFQQAAEAAADLGFRIVSSETAERYQLIKEMNKKR